MADRRFAPRGTLAALSLALASLASAQPLTIDEALRLARERNGTILSARKDVSAARERVTQAQAAFVPTLDATYRYDSNRTELIGDRFRQTEGGASLLRANWRLLDAGERNLSLRGARFSATVQELNATQTLRSTLFSVHQSFFDALRARELLQVSNAQVERARKILEQTELRVELRDAARKDTLQARADLLNAQVAVLEDLNRVANTEANLRAILGLEGAGDLQLQAPADEVANRAPQDVSLETLRADTATLNSFTARALQNRANLRAQRAGVSSQDFALQRAEIQAGLGWNLDLQFTQNVTPRRLEDRQLGLVVSFPLYAPGDRSVVREQRASLESRRALLTQAERDAAAEVESALREVTQNRDRRAAANLALEAARENYRAVEAAQGEGAASLIEVLTAQVSLTTAESNAIQARYDYAVSVVRLRLALGDSIPGES